MVKQALKGAARAVLQRLGYEVRPADMGEPVVDLTQETDDPIAGFFKAGWNRVPVIEAPLSDCLILHTMAFRCTADAGNPFVDALRAYAQEDRLEAAEAVLRRYLDGWQPDTAAEVLGIRGSAFFEPREPLSFVLPWDGLDPAKMETARRRSIVSETRQAGTQIDSAKGYKGWGPSSDEVVSIEARRLVRVYESIRKTGYRRSPKRDGDIEARILYAQGKFRYLLTPGHHRASALAALGTARAPLRLKWPIIREEDVRHWPPVQAGCYTETEALRVFRRIHAGRQPWAADDTIAEIRSSG